ncbi:MAG: hypothetical protein EP329_03170 [Deltaproteobacteria bacterium]|nr:MAG: hypothetical protein EP329_03170 [Deltaproteobacteria bacterium]
MGNRNIGHALLLAAAVTTTGCAGAPTWVGDSAWLEPGATTVEALKRADAAAEAEEAKAPPLSGELKDLVARLLAQSPTVAASRARWRAAIERVPQASTLPNPTLTYTYLPEPVETRVGPNTHRIQLTQAIPFPTKLIAKDDAATALARAAGAAHDRVVRDEVSRLEREWADYYYAARAAAIVDQHVALAKALSEVAATRYGASRGTLFDVSKAQSQLAQLGYDKLRLGEQLEARAAALNATLGRPRRAPLTPPSALPDLAVGLDEDALLALALGHQQELRELDQRLRAADAKVLLAHSSWLPDLGVGVQYLVNGPARMPDVADSGKDALGLMFTLSLPVWLGDNAARVAEANAEREAALAAKKAHLDRLRADLADAVFAERDARRLRTLYDEELLPQAVRAMETAEQWNRADASHFTDFLEARGVYYSFALARERAAADHFKAVVRIEQLIGATLAPAASASPAGAGGAP